MTEIEYTTEEQIEAMREELARAKSRAGFRAVKEKAASELHSNKKQKNHRIFRIISQAVFYAITAALLFVLVSVLVTKSKGEIPNLMGFQLYSVETGSMEPTLNVGAVILSRTPADKAALKKGDVVTYRTNSGTVVTHRIIEVLIDENGNVSYRTKGDNPVNSPDPEPLLPERVLAKFILKIPLT